MKLFRSIKVISLLLVCCLLLGLSPGTCSANQITLQELDRLEAIFNQLEQNNLEQEKKLQRASELLVKSEKQINLLSEKLTIAEQSINQAQNSLQRANQSLTAYEKETNSKIRKLKLERDLSILGIVVMAFIKR